MMIAQRLMKGLVFLPLFLLVSFHTYPVFASSDSPLYSEAPEVLADSVKKVAQDIVSNNDASRLSGYLSDIFLYTVADAVTPPNETMHWRTLKAYKYLGETARTDKNLGASAKSSGSTSTIEKPGFVQLLSFAIENGAIQQEVSGTSLTLSTSPYAFFTILKEDTTKTYEEFGFLNRIGTSATFYIGSQNPLLENVNLKQITEWSVRFRLYGDRSTRSKKFQDFWAWNIKPKIQRRLNKISGAHILIDDDPELSKLRDKIKNLPGTNDAQSKEISLRNKIEVYLRDHKDEKQERKIKDIEEMILSHMRKFVFERIIKDEITIKPHTRAVIKTEVIPSLVESHEELENAKNLLDQYLAQFNKGPLLTFAFTNHRTTISSNYSDFKLLFEQDVKPLTVVANIWVSIYHNPDPMLNQARIRDYGAAISFEGKMKNPFVVSTPDLSKVTYSFSGRYQRTKENIGLPERQADIMVAQFKLELPISMGISFPISITYANATELNKEKLVRGSFGISFDLDKLFALSRQLEKL